MRFGEGQKGRSQLNYDCLFRRIVSTQTYVLHPGDEVTVPWDGKVRLLDPDRLPYCYCAIEADAVPGTYSVILSVFYRFICDDPCEPPAESGMTEDIIVYKSGSSAIHEVPFEIPYLKPELLITF